MTTSYNESSYTNVNDLIKHLVDNGHRGIREQTKYAHTWLVKIENYFASRNFYHELDQEGYFDSSLYNGKSMYEKIIIMHLKVDDNQTNFTLEDLYKELLDFEAWDSDVFNGLLECKIIPVIEAIVKREVNTYTKEIGNDMNFQLVCNLDGLKPLLAIDDSDRVAWFTITKAGDFVPFVNGGEKTLITTSHELEGFFIALVCFYRGMMEIMEDVEGSRIITV